MVAAGYKNHPPAVMVVLTTRRTMAVVCLRYPHLLTAQFAQKCKDGRSGILGGNGREQWVADSGATFHVTDNPVGMVECNPPPPDRSTLVVSDMRSLRVQCFGKLPMTMHSKHGDVQVKLLDVAYVPGVRSTCSRSMQSCRNATLRAMLKEFTCWMEICLSCVGTLALM